MQKYDASELFKKDGEIGKKLIDLFECFKKHNCPLLLISSPKGKENHIEIVIYTVENKDDEIPSIMAYAGEFASMNTEDAKFISSAIDYVSMARANAESLHLMANNIVNATLEGQKHNAN